MLVDTRNEVIFDTPWPSVLAITSRTAEASAFVGTSHWQPVRCWCNYAAHVGQHALAGPPVEAGGAGFVFRSLSGPLTPAAW